MILREEEENSFDQYFVKEPKGKWQKFKSIVTKVQLECRRNIILPVCFMGCFVIKLSLILYNTFILLWLTSFVDSGVLQSDS